jgi:hypothetical protein
MEAGPGLVADLAAAKEQLNTEGIKFELPVEARAVGDV